MKTTIHQPDFMPWYGFFNKLSKVDVWVVLDHVENNPRNSSFWGKRVQVLINGQPYWLSIPLEKPKEKGRIGIPIKDMAININEEKLISKTRRTLEESYKKTPNFNDYRFLIDDYFDNQDKSLINRNMSFIKQALQILGIKLEIVYSSSLNLESSSTTLLVDILKKLPSEHYLSGAGAEGYQDDELFKKNNILVEKNNFIQPEYRQYKANKFFPGLSILDMLFCMPIDDIKSSLNLE